MNTRRSFFKQLGILVPAFSILPSALTYERIWKPAPAIPPIAQISDRDVYAYYSKHYYGKWKFIVRENDAIVVQVEGKTFRHAYPPV